MNKLKRKETNCTNKVKNTSFQSQNENNMQN